MRYFQKLLINLYRMTVLLLIIGAGVVCYGYFYVKYRLPDVDVLKDIHLQVPMQVYTLDGKLIDEFGEKRRIPVKLTNVPKPLIDAVLATEDQRFYTHSGVDPIGLMRAAKQLIMTGKKRQGASTITMQVARNFFLSRKKTYTRKINEILLAIMIDHQLSKNKILELYLNKIYFGNRAYGVAAAAKIYYGKKLSELTLPQMAMIAGLAQAPSLNNPIINPDKAKKRRNHVLNRMKNIGMITTAQYRTATAAPVTARYHVTKPQANAHYLGEMVREALYKQYGDAAYTEGFRVYTTVTSHLQQDANRAVRDQLMAYDRRRGFRGPLKRLGKPDANALQTWPKYLNKHFKTIEDFQPAALLTKTNQGMQAVLASGDLITIPTKGYGRARRRIRPGYVYYVAWLEDKGYYKIVQLPQVEGALVSLNPEDGAVLAVVGGFSYQKSKFNRATQAKLQPGSNFKPFIYSAALAQGFTLSSVINDAPIVVNIPGSRKVWRPQNASRRFYGPTRLRVGLIHSRNLVSIRLLEAIGIPNAIDFLTRFGFDPKDLPRGLSLALGTANVSPMDVAAGYAVFANGGYRVTPYFINHITDLQGNTLFEAKPKLACPRCNDIDALSVQRPPADQIAPQVISPQNAYLITSVLQDVIRRGTGRRALVMKRNDIAGKTGTTNDKYDAWFSGFNGDVVTTVWVGFDQPRSLYEYGGQVALPVWIDFMEKALANKPEHTIPEPPGLIYVRVDPYTGLRAAPGSRGGVFEVFRSQFEPEYEPYYDYTDYNNHYNQSNNRRSTRSPRRNGTGYSQQLF